MSPNPDRSIFTPTGSGPTTHLFFFVPGNPGCIAFYDAFFEYLRESWCAKADESDQLKGTNLVLAGMSLGNFGSTPDRNHPFSLQGQIAFVEQRLYQLTEELRNAEGTTDTELKVVLAGHSVGAFIGMEVLRRWMESAPANTDSLGAKGESSTKLHPKVQILGFIGLWPTITYIMRSPNGKRVGRLLCLTHLARVASVIVSVLTTLLPTSILRLIVRKATGHSDDVLLTTMSFVTHPYQVRQALHMARDEMKEITADRWQDEVWHAGSNGPKLAFLFGSEDEWVDEDAREELLHARKAHDDREGARMDIDQNGIPHSFCIHHSQAVAERTAELIRGIINK